MQFDYDAATIALPQAHRLFELFLSSLRSIVDEPDRALDNRLDREDLDILKSWNEPVSSALPTGVRT